MNERRRSRLARIRILLPVALILGLLGGLSQAQAQPIIFLQSGFTQALVGHAPLGMDMFFGDLAFAPNGDVYTDICQADGSPLYRFDLQQTITDHGTTDHPQAPGSPFASNAGCGLTNHPDGTLYSSVDNGTNGVANLDANTGALIRTFGTVAEFNGTLGSGITVDPQTNRLVYISGLDCGQVSSSTCTILSIDPSAASPTPANFAVLSMTNAPYIGGITFDPTGNFLFIANSFLNRLTILNRSGAIVRNIAMSSTPLGVAFYALAPQFVVTLSQDGTLTRFDFPGNDFTKVPTQSRLGIGLFGNFLQRGPDGCLYVTQLRPGSTMARCRPTTA